jgi:hypothetical protein
VATFKVEMKRVNKYKSRRVSYDYHNFSSKLEASVYTILKSRENAGEIRIIQVQDHVYLTEARVLYVCDFKCLNLKTNDFIWVEAKGVEIPTWILKKKLWTFYGPGLLQIYKGSFQRPFIHEEIWPKGLKLAKELP